jgi:hypothetical protein
MVQRGGLE